MTSYIFPLFFFLTHWEETIELTVYTVCYGIKIFRVTFEIYVITIYDKQLSLITLNPIFISVVKTLQVIDTHALLEVAPTLLDMTY